MDTPAALTRRRFVLVGAAAGGALVLGVSLRRVHWAQRGAAD